MEEWGLRLMSAVGAGRRGQGTGPEAFQKVGLSGGILRFPGSLALWAGRGSAPHQGVDHGFLLQGVERKTPPARLTSAGCPYLPGRAPALATASGFWEAARLFSLSAPILPECPRHVKPGFAYRTPTLPLPKRRRPAEVLPGPLVLECQTPGPRTLGSVCQEGAPCWPPTGAIGAAHLGAPAEGYSGDAVGV